MALFVTGISIVSRHVLGWHRFIAPSVQLTKATIGVGGIGQSHLNYEETKFLAICDVDSNYISQTLKKVGGDVKGYQDFKEIRIRPDIDIIYIATSSHWYGLMAAEAGKDVWCEKPMAKTIDEGKRVVEVMEQYGRMFRLNIWVRFKDNFYGMGVPVKKLKKVADIGALGWPLECYQWCYRYFRKF